jgi:hypothetical protein
MREENKKKIEIDPNEEIELRIVSSNGMGNHTDITDQYGRRVWNAVAVKLNCDNPYGTWNGTIYAYKMPVNITTNTKDLVLLPSIRISVLTARVKNLFHKLYRDLEHRLINFYRKHK